jgi:hypothetical protein
MTRKAHNSGWKDGIFFKETNFLGPSDLLDKEKPDTDVPRNTIISRLTRLRHRNELTDKSVSEAMYLSAKQYQPKYGKRKTYITISGKAICLNDEYDSLKTSNKPAVTYQSFRSRLTNRSLPPDLSIIKDAFGMEQSEWVAYYGGGKHHNFTYIGELFPEYYLENFHSFAAFFRTINRYKDKKLIWGRIKQGWPLDEAIQTPAFDYDENRTGRIYKITLLKTGQFYVGLTVLTVEERWYYHKKAAENGAMNRFAKAIREHDGFAFKFETLEDNIPLGNPLSIREGFWFDLLNALGEQGLNTAKPGGLAGARGISIIVGDKTFPSYKEAGRIIGEERGIEPHVVERCLRENKPIPYTQRRHSKHPEAGTNLFRRHLALLARHKGNIDPRWLDYDSFKSDIRSLQPEMKLMRMDNKKPWGPNNFKWMSSTNAVMAVHGKPITIF